MKQKQVYIFHAAANTEEAQQIAQDINSSDVNCIIHGSSTAKTAAWQAEPNALAVLVISDNFLKSLHDIRHLEVLLEDSQQGRVLSVLAHGRKQKEGTNQWEEYPTEIHTLNNVMHYRDFWYEEWINLRKQSKQVAPEQQAQINEDKEVAKKMSVGSISTYIRKINKAPATEWSTMQKNNYKDLLAKLANISAIESNNAFAEEVEIVTKTTNSPDDTPSNEEETIISTIEVPPVDENIAIIEYNSEEEKEEENPVTDVAENIEINTDEEEQQEEAFELNLDNTDDKDIEGTLAEYKIEEVTDIDILFHLAESNTEEGDFEDAKLAYERILQLDPYNGRALIWISRLLANHFDKEGIKADTYYKKAIMVNDENAKLYYEYGLLQQKYFDSYYKASDSYREAIAIDPMLEVAYFGLAECLQKLGMEEQAKANYLQACVLDSSRFESQENDQMFGVVRHFVAEEIEELPQEEDLEQMKPRSPNTDTVVLVTGATSGIGKAVAEQFAINGYKVIATGRRADRLEDFKKNLSEAFDEIELHCLAFDVTDLNATKKALDSLPENWKNIDILINNAGLAKGLAPIQEGNIDFWNTMIDTNLKGLLFMTRLVSPSMVERQQGHVVNIGSVAGKQGYAGGGVYCATKAAVDSLTHTMRLDLHKHNIKVTCVSPGHVATEFAAVRYAESKERNTHNSYEGFTPLTAKDVADMVYYTVSRPDHVNIQDILMFGTQQASATTITRNNTKE